MTTIPPVHRLHDGQPLLRRIEQHPWENRVTFNPACALVSDRTLLSRIIPELPFDERTRRRLWEQPALCFLLYRAQGERTPAYDHTRSSIGLAILSPTLELLARHTEPVLKPDQPYENLGAEDARITQIGSRFYMLYTAYRSATPENQVRLALASTTDFVHWDKHGLLQGDVNGINNKNSMLFPERLNGRYVMLHRPMEGKDRLCIHRAESDDLFGTWKSMGTLMRPIPNPSFVDTWIGGGAPPLKLPDGRYLILYHIGNRKADGSREYDLGIAVGDAGTRDFIVRRDEPFFRPATSAETIGDTELGVNNVVFICAAYFYDGDLYMPYAGADSVVLGAKIAGEDLDRYLRQE
jgi:predicted GH43/DUF377 family glycosyl hydrolase